MKKTVKVLVFIIIVLLFSNFGQKIMRIDKIQKLSLRTAGVQQADMAVADAGAGKYAYEMLDQDEKLIYNQIVDGVKNWKKNITVSTNDSDKLERAYQAVSSEHAEIFWVEGYGFTIYEVGGLQADYVFEPKYAYTEKEVQQKQEKIDAYVAECLEGLASEASDYEKVKYIYEYIIKNTEYNLTAGESQNICSVFIQRSSVCMGYARAMQYLLQSIGISCTVVSGTADGEAHAWNLVQMDGDYYYVDATWGEPNVTESSIQNKETVNYAYLGVRTAELFQSHQPDGSITLPECIATADNYYVREGKFLTEYNEKLINSILIREYNNGNSITIKCADSDIYGQLYEYLIQKASICTIIDCEGISYLEDVRNNIFTIYPQNERK